MRKYPFTEPRVNVVSNEDQRLTRKLQYELYTFKAVPVEISETPKTIFIAIFEFSGVEKPGLKTTNTPRGYEL